MKKFATDSTIKILELFASALLRKNKPIIVAVTGSVGKSSTKNAIAEVLRAKYRVMAHEGYNSEIGVPLSLFEIEAPKSTFSIFAWFKILIQMTFKLFKKFPYDVVVVEMGAARPGGIANLLRYIKPDIGVVTAVHEAHYENFKSIDAVFVEKSLVALAAQRAVINIDDDLIYQKLLPQLRETETSTYGMSNNHAEKRFEKVVRQKSGLLEVCYEDAMIKTQLLGEHNLYSLLVAATVAELLDVDKSEVVARLAQVRPVRGRMNIIAGTNNSRIIDDSYNSSPKAAVEAVLTLDAIEAPRKIAVIGSMNELGEFSEEGHTMIARALAAHPVDVLITIGDDARSYIALHSEMMAKDVFTFDSPYAAGAKLKSVIKNGDLVLVKGSQNGVFAEEAIKSIIANKSDIDQLVRQSEFWMNKKRAQFDDA